MDLKEALLRLLRELDDYRGKSENSAGEDEPELEPIEKGLHHVWLAVEAVEKLYEPNVPKPKLPNDGNEFWFELLQESRATEENRDRRAIQKAAKAFRNWVVEQKKQTETILVLNRRQYDILQSLLKLKAIDAANLRNAKEIAQTAEGKQASPEAFKEPLSDLKHRKLVDSKEGRGGGYWLTRAGIEEARKL